MRTLIQANTAALNELRGLVDCFDASQFADSQLPDLSPPGKHVRHVTDHYHRFAEGCRTGVIDYDQRSRDSAQERCQIASGVCLEYIQSTILTHQLQDQRVNVITTVDATRNPYSVISSVRRELIYLLNHTVHHTALLSVVARLKGVALVPAGGVAPSTQRWENMSQRQRESAPEANLQFSQA